MTKLVVSDKQMGMSPDILSKFVMLRHSKLAIAALKETYKDEAQHSPMTSPLGCVRFHWSLQSLPTPSHWTMSWMMSLFSHPGTPTRNRTSRACC